MSMPGSSLVDRLQYKYIPETWEQRTILIVLWIALLFAVIMPLMAIIIFSFTRVFPLREAGYVFTFENYASLFRNLSFLLDITINTFWFAGGTTLVALIIGAMTAFFTVKYVQSEFIRVIMLLPYGIPSVAALNGWFLLLGNSGLITDIMIKVFGFESTPYDFFSIWGMIWVESMHTAPVAFLFLLPAFSAVTAEMDEASFIAGGSRIETFKDVILPIVWPSIISTSLFLFARAMAVVATPALLGLPERTFTYGSVIPFVFLSGILDYSKALAFSVLITVISAILIAYYLRVQSRGEKYTTVTGQGQRRIKRYETSKTRRVLGIGLISLYLFVGGIMPLLAIIWNSLLPADVLQLSTNLGQFTLQNYIALFQGTAPGLIGFYGALRNTLLVGILVPTTSMFIVLMIAYSNQMLNIVSGRYLAFIASLPLAIPGIARSMGFLAAFLTTPLYGTFWILFVAFHGFAIPIGIRYASPALTRLDAMNSESALMSGASAVETFREIILPLTFDDFIAGWVHMFVSIVRNVTIPILLFTVGSKVVAVVLLNLIAQGQFKTASTLAVVLTMLSLVPYMAIQYYRIKKGKQMAGAI